MRTMSTSTGSLAPTPTATASLTIVQHSPWHSPIPYLFGGLAAMLGLIAFALLILACSYWKLSVQSQNEEASDRDLEKQGDSANNESVKVYEEKILVIMAGDEKPTFLATPVCAKFLSFGDGIGNDFDKHNGNHEIGEKSGKEIDSHVATPRETLQQSQ